MPEEPALPNIKPSPPSAETAAAVARWNALIEFRPAPAAVLALFAQHPELAAWAEGSIVGGIRITQP